MDEAVLVEVRPAAELGDDLRGQIAQWTVDMFGVEELKYEWSRPDWHVLVWLGDELVTQLAITERVAQVGGEAVRLAGIGGVMTPKQLRGRGLANAAMRSAVYFMKNTLDAEFGLLLCSARLVPYYERLGWQLVAAPVRFEQSTGDEMWEEEAMVMAFTDRPWPPGAVALCGPPW